MAAGPGISELLYVVSLGNKLRGFGVRIPRPDTRKLDSKNFSSVRAPLGELLARAKKWRDTRYQELYGEAIPGRVFHTAQSNNSATGIPGVRRVLKTVNTKYRKDGYNRALRIHSVPVYIAEIWLEPGKDGKRPTKSRSKLFAINKYGEELAFELAVLWRKEMEKRLLSGPEKFELWWAQVKRKEL